MATQTKTASKAAKPAAKKTPAKRKPAAKKPAEPTAREPKDVFPDPPFEVTPIDDAVSIKIEDQKAIVNIKGTFDLEGIIAVHKRVDRARAELA